MSCVVSLTVRRGQEPMDITVFPLSPVTIPTRGLVSLFRGSAGLRPAAGQTTLMWRAFVVSERLESLGSLVVSGHQPPDRVVLLLECPVVCTAERFEFKDGCLQHPRQIL